jgi:hypothetical protein
VKMSLRWFAAVLILATVSLPTTMLASTSPDGNPGGGPPPTDGNPGGGPPVVQHGPVIFG